MAPSHPSPSKWPESVLGKEVGGGRWGVERSLHWLFPLPGMFFPHTCPHSPLTHHPLGPLVKGTVYPLILPSLCPPSPPPSYFTYSVH